MSLFLFHDTLINKTVVPKHPEARVAAFNLILQEVSRLFRR